jgi:hypothetical protein
VKVVTLQFADPDGDTVSIVEVVVSGVLQAELQASGQVALRSTAPGTGTVFVRFTDGTHTVVDFIDVRALGPQPSCFHVLAQDAQGGNGVYPLIAGNTGYTAYCDMEQHGGGWTLTVKPRGSNNDYQFGNNRWTNATLQREANHDLIADDNAKLRSYLSVKVEQLLLAFSPIGSTAFRFVPEPMDLDGSFASLHAVMNAGPRVLQTPSRDAWIAADPAFAGQLQQLCGLVGINLERGNRKVHIGILGSSALGGNSCDSAESFIGFGADRSNQTTGASNGSSATVRFGAVLVRSRDLTDVRSADGREFLSCDDVRGEGFVGAARYRVLGADVICNN